MTVENFFLPRTDHRNGPHFAQDLLDEPVLVHQRRQGPFARRTRVARHPPHTDILGSARTIAIVARENGPRIAQARPRLAQDRVSSRDTRRARRRGRAMQHRDSHGGPSLRWRHLLRPRRPTPRSDAPSRGEHDDEITPNVFKLRPNKTWKKKDSNGSALLGS